MSEKENQNLQPALFELEEQALTEEFAEQLAVDSLSNALRSGHRGSEDNQVNPGTARYFGVDGIGGGLPEDSGAIEPPKFVRPARKPRRTGNVRSYESDTDLPVEPYTPQTEEEKRAFEASRTDRQALRKTLSEERISEIAGDDPVLLTALKRREQEKRP